MMDVVRAQEAEEDVISKIDRVAAEIEGNDNIATDEIIRSLNALDKRVLEGDWGGYYEEYRRPLIARLDALRDKIGQQSPERSDDVWNRPAPRTLISPQIEPQRTPASTSRYRNASRNSNQDTLNQNGHYELELAPEGKYDGDCVICLGKFTVDEEKSYTKCGHRFHGPCIRMWSRVKRGNGISVPCPVCGTNILSKRNEDKVSATLHTCDSSDPDLDSSRRLLNISSTPDETEPVTLQKMKRRLIGFLHKNRVYMILFSLGGIFVMQYLSRRQASSVHSSEIS